MIPKDLFDFEPQIPGMGDDVPEASIRELIFEYFSSHEGNTRGRKHTEEYINQIIKQFNYQKQNKEE